MTTGELPSFGTMLRQFRRAAGLSQEALAERAGLSVRAVSSLERGVRQRPYPHTVGQLARALRLTAAERTRLVAATSLRHDLVRPAEIAVGPETSMPVALSSFVGRGRELAEIRGRLGETRLLTLTGTGGVGKTRLALEIASAVQDDYPDGVWLIELAPLADPALVPPTVARVLGVSEQPRHQQVETVVRWLARRQALLVLDNCEHLLDACANLAEAVLRVCPRVRILATSRERFNVAGEMVWRVPSLTMPAAQATSHSIMTGGDAIRLFVERARAVAPDFVLTSTTAPAVAQICRQLDGIPLALELAAARLSALSVELLASRLEDRLRLLTGGSRTAPPRQRTLRETLDWSHALLVGPERVVFRRLAVFAGGWTLDAAEAVCADGPVAVADVLELLGRLVEKSLVVVEAHAGATRFRLLETIRQYAGEQLLAAGEDAPTRERHRDWCLALAERAEPKLRGREQIIWLERLEVEHDNLRVALDWSHGREEGGAAELRLAGALGEFWLWRGYFVEGLTRLSAALERDDGTLPVKRALVLNWAGTAAARMGTDHRAQARAWLEESRSLALAGSDWRLAAKATIALARVAGASDDPAERRQLLGEALRLARLAGEPYELTWALAHMAHALRSQGDEMAARSLLDEGLALGRASGERSSQFVVLVIMAWQAIDDGEYGRARALLQEALAASRAVSFRSAIARQLAPLGLVARLEGDFPTAQAHFREALDTAERIADRGMMARLVIELAGVNADLGAPRQAARLWGATENWRTSALAAHESDRDYAARYERDLAAVRATLGEASFVAAWAAGQALSLDQAVAEALASPAPATRALSQVARPTDKMSQVAASPGEDRPESPQS